MCNINKYILGTVIIVGEKTKDKFIFKTGGTVVYDSFCLVHNANDIYLLQDNTKAVLSNRVYICGHGSKKTQRISGYTMEEIANKLHENFKLSRCDIKIVSCYGRYKNAEQKDMSFLLTEELQKLGYKKFSITALAEYTSIVSRDAKLNMALIRDNDFKLSRKKEDMFYIIQNTMEILSNSLEISLDVNTDYHMVLNEKYKHMRLLKRHNERYLYKN